MGAKEERPWSAIVRETITQNPYFSVQSEDVTTTDGSERLYYTIRFSTPAVGIVARRDRDFLLIRQYRFIVDQFVWAIPSGGVANDESAEQAALRELEEETGYTADSVRPLLTCYASYGCSDQRFEVFYADSLRPTTTCIDPNEVIEARWFSRDEVRDMVSRNGIVDSLSLSPILLTLLNES